jgi:hypothetical protein
MSSLLYTKDSQLTLLNSLQGKEFFTVIINGKNYRVQLSTLVQLVLASQPAPADTRRYWQTVPGYTVDDALREITVDASGVAYYNSTSNSIAGATLLYSAIAVSGNSRFDGLVLDTESGTYDLITGVEGLDPSTPGYNTQRYMLLAWILIDENGSVVDEAPQDHPRNQDQYLDQGGVNEISAAQAKGAYLKSLHFAGVFDDVASLPTGASAPTVRSFALVGTTALSIYLYSVASAAWVEIQGSNSGTTRDLGHFADLAALQTAHPSPAAGSVATVEDEDTWYHWDASATTPVWKKGAGESTATGFAYPVIFQELDNVSYPIPFEGPKTGFSTAAPPEITSISYEAKLGSASTWTAIADIASLESWIATNVTTDTTLWQLKVIVNAISNETSILLKWQ